MIQRPSDWVVLVLVAVGFPAFGTIYWLRPSKTRMFWPYSKDFWLAMTRSVPVLGWGAGVLGFSGILATLFPGVGLIVALAGAAGVFGSLFIGVVIVLYNRPVWFVPKHRRREVGLMELLTPKDKLKWVIGLGLMVAAVIAIFIPVASHLWSR